MSPKVPQLKKQQLDLIDKGLRSVWIVAIGAAFVLIGFVYLLSRNTPPPLGEQDQMQSEQSAR
jgi:hypothetical protein